LKIEREIPILKSQSRTEAILSSILLKRDKDGNALYDIFLRLLMIKQAKWNVELLD